MLRDIDNVQEWDPHISHLLELLFRYCAIRIWPDAFVGFPLYESAIYLLVMLDKKAYQD